MTEYWNTTTIGLVLFDNAEHSFNIGTIVVR